MLQNPASGPSYRRTIVGVRTADFDYDLPTGLIAQQTRPRGTSRLLVLDRCDDRLEVTRISALPGLLAPGDLLLANDVRVIPARVRFRRPGGGAGELLLVRPHGDASWETMARPGKRLRPGIPLQLAAGRAIPVERLANGRWRVQFDPPLDAAALEAVGEVPLPPYIERPEGPDDADRRRYQTVYAVGGRAVAAPTAGLHFTPELMAACRDRGIEVATVTLHVGPGTFKPVEVEDPRRHVLDVEDYEVSPRTAAALNRALAAGRRIVCVGTTSCRALEHALAGGARRISPGRAAADVFIMPGSVLRGTGALLTNFHLPRSTLLMLVSALVGRERALAAYRFAAVSGFGFYSFGDAMLIL